MQLLEAPTGMICPWSARSCRLLQRLAGSSQLPPRQHGASSGHGTIFLMPTLFQRASLTYLPSLSCVHSPPSTVARADIGARAAVSQEALSWILSSLQQRAPAARYSGDGLSRTKNNSSEDITVVACSSNDARVVADTTAESACMWRQAESTAES